LRVQPRELETSNIGCHTAQAVSQAVSKEIKSMQVFTTLRELRFGDCDISGTAYFPAYLNILNGVNEEFWTHLGYPWHDVIAKERWGTPTVHLSCDFSKPSFFGETLKFELIVTGVVRSTAALRHKISVADHTRWTCTQVLASSDLDSHTAKPWDGTVKSLLETWQIAVDEQPF
jgi:4-hydroxybenzoyl-CoA thioesterase